MCSLLDSLFLKYIFISFLIISVIIASKRLNIIHYIYTYALIISVIFILNLRGAFKYGLSSESKYLIVFSLYIVAFIVRKVLIKWNTYEILNINEKSIKSVSDFLENNQIEYDIKTKNGKMFLKERINFNKLVEINDIIRREGKSDKFNWIIVLLLIVFNIYLFIN